jgi:hypothetical protein
MSLTNELRIAIALLEIPVSGWTCLRTVRRVNNHHLDDTHDDDAPL